MYLANIMNSFKVCGDKISFMRPEQTAYLPLSKSCNELADMS